MVTRMNQMMTHMVNKQIIPVPSIIRQKVTSLAKMTGVTAWPQITGIKHSNCRDTAEDKGNYENNEF